jgi:hypothetical protein
MRSERIQEYIDHYDSMALEDRRCSFVGAARYPKKSSSPLMTTASPWK